MLRVTNRIVFQILAIENEKDNSWCEAFPI